MRGRLSWLLDPGGGLAQRVANAGAWAFALNMTNRVLVTVRTVVLARLLAPEDFGLMGIAMLIIGMVGQLTQTGFRGALIQRRGELEEDDLDTAWTTEAARGVLLGGVLVLSAPAVERFFGTAQAGELLQLMALGVVIGGFTNTGVITFDRELEFQKRFVFRSIPVLTSLAVSIGLALILRNAWALAFGWVAGKVAAVIASFWAHPHRPHLRWDRRRARQLFRFGIWLFGSNLLIYLTLNLDDLVVGRVLGATALGLYQIAFSISQLMTTEVTTVVNSVAFPAYSKLQHDPERLRRAYLKTLQFVTLISVPLAAGLLFVGDEAVRVFLGDRWLPILPAFQVLLLWGLIRSVLATTGPLFQGVGRPHLATHVQLAQLILLAVFIYPFTQRWGIEGAAWATVAAAILPDGAAILLASKVSTAPLGSVLKLILYPVAHSAVMLAVLLLLEGATPLPGGALLLLWAPPAGATTYFALAWISRVLLGYAKDGLLGGVTRGVGDSEPDLRDETSPRDVE